MISAPAIRRSVICASFPFDKIKIDQSFVRDLNKNKDAIAIIHAMSGLGTSLGMTTTVEGVETKEQLELVRAEGCTEVQGYLFSRPQPASEVPRMLARLGRKSQAERCSNEPDHEAGQTRQTAVRSKAARA